MACFDDTLRFAAIPGLRVLPIIRRVAAQASGPNMSACDP